MKRLIIKKTIIALFVLITGFAAQASQITKLTFWGSDRSKYVISDKETINFCLKNLGTFEGIVDGFATELKSFTGEKSEEYRSGFKKYFEKMQNKVRGFLNVFLGKAFLQIHYEDGTVENRALSKKIRNVDVVIRDIVEKLKGYEPGMHALFGASYLKYNDLRDCFEKYSDDKLVSLIWAVDFFNISIWEEILINSLAWEKWGNIFAHLPARFMRFAMILLIGEYFRYVEFDMRFGRFDGFDDHVNKIEDLKNIFKLINQCYLNGGYYFKKLIRSCFEKAVEKSNHIDVYFRTAALKKLEDLDFVKDSNVS